MGTVHELCLLEKHVIEKSIGICKLTKYLPSLSLSKPTYLAEPHAIHDRHQVDQNRPTRRFEERPCT